jgi:hypothetical protein
MRCNVCNSELAPNAKFCSNCGSVISADNTYQSNDFNHQNPTEEGWHGDNNRAYNPQTGFYTPVNLEMPMKWYKFLIYFALFFAAFLNVYNGIQILTGSQYTYNGNDQSDLVYSYFSGLKVIDFIYGLLILGLAVFLIITRQKLKNFSKQGPKFIMVLYIANIGFSLFYLFTVTIITDIKLSELLTTRFITSIIVALVMIFVNKSYFDKRVHLFVN